MVTVVNETLQTLGVDDRKTTPVLELSVADSEKVPPDEYVSVAGGVHEIVCVVPEFEKA
jgi:hypothetical protein